MSIHQLAVIHENATIGAETTIGPFAVIGEHVTLGKGCVVGPHVVIDGHTEIGDHCAFHAGASIGSPPQDLKYQGEQTRLIIGDNCTFREYTTVNIGTIGGGGVTRVGSQCVMMAYAHIAHDCLLGDNVIMANSVALSGHVTIEDYAIIGGLVGVHQFVRIGAHCIIGGCSAVAQDVPPYAMASGGERARIYGLNSVGLKRRHFSAETLKALKHAYRILFRSKLSLKHAAAQVREELPDLPEVQNLLRFVEGSERGICKGATKAALYTGF
ncbi:acyl-[acyl-carrier-protein]--UDP-N-acetylglucosamine O-acyltransferase [candidate division KSB3 bacterium]|uniref:Acyl-[acyl-carrier-protein]--UDP-N-acetylglucosamine O-acyltransferase n=1 Tax=candidate division KSB3 bacterium TaxID=2044937 RepID=A0A2G6E3Z1_9BACT|nr:MAG: acyl-[acyl-carrier-protein]--UDP-N-acetylglucosamine O-acyltransferase [candidate division KSB3 bacterium]PIE29317.1 MAG: acyl-[acyl-carrier-protein]--UDP-N-acetylglucosamine O-acyltransferase [candidate division KSB3 bacterium]